MQPDDPQWIDQMLSMAGATTMPNDEPIHQADMAGLSEDKKLITALNCVYRHEQEVRRPKQRLWDRAWDRYNCLFDFGKKRPWQSRRSLPTVTILAHKYTWEMLKIFELAGDNFFEVTTEFDQFRDVMNVPKSLLLDYLRPTSTDDDEGLMVALYDFILGACVSDVGHMLVMPVAEGVEAWEPPSDTFSPTEEGRPDDIELPDLSFAFGDSPQASQGYPEFEEIEDGFRIKFEAIHPRYVLVDSNSGTRPAYKMWVQKMTPAKFREYAEVYGWENVEAVVQSAKESDGPEDADSASRDARERREAVNTKKFNLISVVHFIGDLHDERGERVFKGKYCCWAGEFILKQPYDLQLWHKKIPIVSGSLMREPWNAYGRSLLTLNLDPQEARVELLNMMLDYMQQVINPPTEIDHDQLHPAFGMGQVRGGVMPGAAIHVNKMGRSYPALARSAAPDVGSNVFQGIAWFKQEWAEASGLADTGAMPRTRNRISAKEFQERNAASQGIWQMQAKNIERVVSKVLHQAYLLILQSVPQKVWEAKITHAENLAEGNQPLLQKLGVMKQWGPQERWKYCARPFSFKVTVYSAIESRREQLEQVATINEIAAGNPVAAQRVRWHKVMEKAMIAIEEDPNEMLWPNTGDTAEQMSPMGVPGEAEGGPNVPTPIAPPPPGQRGL